MQQKNTRSNAHQQIDRKIQDGARLKDKGTSVAQLLIL